MKSYDWPTNDGDKETMNRLMFSKELYPKIALIKAAYNFTDKAFVHLDADKNYYYVSIETKRGNDEVTEGDFTNEMLCQSVRHEVYLQTKNIRELLLARAMATSVVLTDDSLYESRLDIQDNEYDDKDILRDWFDNNDKVEN